MPGEAAAKQFWRVGVSQSAWSQAVQPEDGLVVCVVNCEKGFRGAGFVALAGVTLQGVIQRRIATVEGLPIMFFKMVS